MFGPPGVGKGTQAQRLSAVFQIPHVATGDMLRNAIRSDTPLGKRAKEFIDQGQLVPDEVVLELVAERLRMRTPRAASCSMGFHAPSLRRRPWAGC